MRDASRVQQIVLEHVDAIWRTARRLGVPPADVDDVAQEVALVILRRESAIQAGKERAFVIGSTARIASNWRRSRRRQPQPLEIPEAAVVSRLRRGREVFQSFCQRRQLESDGPVEEGGNG